jgi:chromosome segregation ATPase
MIALCTGIVTMSLEDTELTIGGTSFKGVWIAIVLGIGSTIGGGVWTASSLYSRLESVEARVIPDVAPIEEKISLIETQLKDNNVAQLQGKLAELGTNLVTIKDNYDKMLEFKEEIGELKQKVTKMETVVQKAELVTEEIKEFEDDVKLVKKEIQDLWDGMDYLSNPLK